LKLKQVHTELRCLEQGILIIIPTAVLVRRTEDE
jgi:hypothetical protein